MCDQKMSSAMDALVDNLNKDRPENLENLLNSVPIPVLTVRKRERRSISPVASAFLDNFPEPLSPGSSTDQASSIDATFEPTIEMMVDDFDDEQTLNEEEALAAMESLDPKDEIDTLQKESEMPIEELLEKYRAVMPVHSNAQSVRKKGKSSGKAKNKKHSKAKISALQEHQVDGKNNEIEQVQLVAEDIIVIDSGDDENGTVKEGEEGHADIAKDDIQNCSDVLTTDTAEKKKHRRSHLMDLYPESFSANENIPRVTALEALSDGDDDNDEEDEAHDSDYIRKTIMVGSAYQAVIPTGLSKYGDILPYENEDKLIWEPSQVSEKEVEEYLMKTRELKNNLPAKEDQCEENHFVIEDIDTGSKHLSVLSKRKKSSDNQHLDRYQLSSVKHNLMAEVIIDSDFNKVVKDNEQALHLLVQCGYDFKEALRRKSLNAVPLAGSMSIWSEEECRKFEEGIQKFGKDFLKIRQQQVRTRSMRELVQFYYLWKKSDRRDHEFADSDTVDHMDMYLNEGDYNSNSITNTNLHMVNSSAATSTETLSNRRGLSSCAPIKFSIMTGISNQHVFSQKSGHGRRYGSNTHSSEQVLTEKIDCHHIPLTLRK